MLCERCNQREATNHICKVVDGVKQTEDLCSECLGSSDAPVAAFAASVRSARCSFCGAPANMGGTDSLALCVGEHHLTCFCFGCSQEYIRYVGSAKERMVKGLSQEQQIQVLRQLREDAEKHMKDWVLRRGEL